MNRRLLESAGAEIGLQISEQQSKAFELLLHELLRWNKRINLTAITSPDEMTVKHLIDSLHLVPHLRHGEHLLDIGSGAGFPALVLAVMRPDCFVSSIDAVGKKVSFQRHIARLLKLDNLQPLHGRAEELAIKQPGSFDLVASRAFSSLILFAELTAPLVCQGGRIISMRSSGGANEAEQDREQLHALKLRTESVVNYGLPMQMGGRSLVILRKGP